MGQGKKKLGTHRFRVADEVPEVGAAGHGGVNPIAGVAAKRLYESLIRGVLNSTKFGIVFVINSGKVFS